MLNRTIFIFIICMFAAACNTTKPAVNTDTAMTYSLQVQDLRFYKTDDSILQATMKKLGEEGFVAASPKNADVSMKVVLTRSRGNEFEHEGPGNAPILSGFASDPLSLLVNAAYFLGWAAKETGKAAINASSYESVVTMKLTYVTANNKAYEVQQKVGLHTNDEDKGMEQLLKVLPNSIVEHMKKLRRGDNVDEAVVVENTYVVTTLRAPEAPADK